MTTPTNPIERLDVPESKVAADMAALVARQNGQRDTEAERLWAERDRRVAALHAREGLLAEQRHQLLDLDPDSAFTLPGSCCVNCPPKTPGAQS